MWGFLALQVDSTKSKMRVCRPQVGSCIGYLGTLEVQGVEPEALVPKPS